MSEANRRPPTRPKRRGILGVEALEGRSLLALTFQFADAVAVTGSGSVDVESNSVTNDSAGNVYVTGSLQGTADFDPGAGVFNLASTGGRDVFLAKYTNAGALVWAKDLRGADSTAVAQGGGITVDASGNVLVTGTFTGTVNFDPNAGTTSFSAPGRNDVYISKFDPNGSLLWARDVVGTAGAIDEGYAVAVDGSGNVAVAGSFQNSATFGTFSLSAGGSFDSFVAKLSPAGTFLWAAGTTGSGSSVAQSAGVKFDGEGNVVSTGFFAQTVNFNPGSGTLNLPYAGSRDIFVQKLSPAGGLVWAVGLGGADIDQGNAIAADAAGNIYITGTFSSTVNFNPGSPPANLSAGGFEDGFLLKLSSAGQFSWVKDQLETGFSAAQGTGVALDGSGHVFTAGYYQVSLSLDPTASGALLRSAGSYDVFVAEYDANGDFLAGQSAGGKDFDAGFGIGVNSAGLVAIAGRYTGPATFGPTTLPAQSSKSIFISQLSSATPSGPAAPNAPSLQAASDSGLSNSDRITNVVAPVFDLSGIAAGGNLVELLRDGVAVGRRTGAGPITDPGPVPVGSHVYTARQTDLGGLVSPLSGSTGLTVDTRIPSTPAALALLAADDSGAKGDGLTNVKQPRLTGVLDPLTRAQLLDSSGNVVASVLTAADGSFALAFPSPLADGAYTYRVREETVAGNFSAASGSFSLTIDATAPAAPSSPTLLAADDTGAIGDGITSISKPRLIGTAGAGLTVQLMNASGTILGTTTSATDGTFTVPPTSAFADGTYALRFQAIDAAGNLSAASGSFTMTIDTTAPISPTTPTLLTADDSGVVGDGVTNVKQPRLTGNAGAGLTVVLLDPTGRMLGQGSAASGGTYTVAFGSPLADGTYPVRARSVDVAGNVSVASATFSLTILTAAPAAPTTPTLLAADDSGTVGDGMTTVQQPHLIGSATAGVVVQMLDAGNNVLGSASAAADGSYSILVASPFSLGTYSLHARATDAAGNVGASSATFTLTIQGSGGPATPSAPVLLGGDDSGVSGDGITNFRRPRLVGTSTVGTTVQILTASGTLIGAATTAPDGSYTITPSADLADATYSLQARALDASNTAGSLSGTFSLTIDTTAPAAPAGPALLAADDSGVQGDGITNVAQPRFIGTAEAGSTVQLVLTSGNVLATATAGADGSYLIPTPSKFTDGTYALRTSAIDAAGNVGASGPILTLVIVTSAPTPGAPALLAADDTGAIGDGRTTIRQPRLTGTSVPGDTVDLLDPNGIVLASTSSALTSGDFILQPATNLSAGTLPLRLRLRDVAGNVSRPGPAFNLTIADAAIADFEGDGKSDMAVFRPANGLWAINRSSGGANSFTLFGGARYYDIPAPGDYNGDGTADLAVFRPSTAQWIIKTGSALRVISFGTPNLFDIPVPGDYDGVGYTEPAVFRPSTGQWFVLGPTGGRLLGNFGAPNLFDLPVPGDYDGIGRTELAVFRPSTAQWFVLGPTGGRLLGNFGAPNFFDIPIPGDYDGIGRTELAVFRPSTAQFLVLSPSGGRVLGSFGERFLYDIPPQAPIAALRKLGTVGGIRLASVTAGASAAPKSAALTVASGGATPEPVVYLAPVPSKKRAAQDVVSLALDSLTLGD